LTGVTPPEAANDTLSQIKAAQAGVARPRREAEGDRLWRYSKAAVATMDLKLSEDAPRALIGHSSTTSGARR
jgi:DNA polymerase V